MSFQATKVLSISRCKYKSESHVVKHSHNFHHILYVVDGHGVFKAEGQTHGMNMHDMYVIPPGMYHSFWSDPSRPLCTIEVKALLGDPQLEAYLQPISIRLVLPHVKIKLLLEAMLDEAANGRPQYKEIITAHFIEFIMNMRRMHDSGMENGESVTPVFTGVLSGREPEAKRLHATVNTSDGLAGQAIQYIHANYGRKIVLKDLARKLAVSSAHLCRVFCSKYEMSPMQYLNHWRLHEAKELLKNTELSVTEIADRVGFQSVHYLSRRFTAKEQMSPLQYRQKLKEIVEWQIEDKLEIVDHKILL